MIDLHSHILPGIDDGATSLEVSLEMARMAVADGVHTMACTPHIYPGLYMNDAQGIARARQQLQIELEREGVELKLVDGADVHLVPGLVEGLRGGGIPTLNGSRYVLLEPSHHVRPPRLEETVFDLVVSGYTPMITHPERLTWIEDHHEVFGRLVRQGAWLQVTGGALSGQFGKRAQYWGERLLGEGLVHILASDAHTTGRRSPGLSKARAVAERLMGVDEARRLVLDRPQAILSDLPPSQVPPPPEAAPQRGWFQRLFQR